MGDDVHWMGSSPKFLALTSKILVGNHTTTVTHRAENISKQRSGANLVRFFPECDLGSGHGEESFNHQDLRIIGQPPETIGQVSESLGGLESSDVDPFEWLCCVYDDGFPGAPAMQENRPRS